MPIWDAGLSGNDVYSSLVQEITKGKQQGVNPFPSGINFSSGNYGLLSAQQKQSILDLMSGKQPTGGGQGWPGGGGVIPTLPGNGAAGTGWLPPGTFVPGGGTATPTGAKGNVYQDLAAQYQAMMDKANAANESRYAEILKGYDDRTKNVMGQVSAGSQSQVQDIQRALSEATGRGYQDLTNRGLRNTTLGANMEQLAGQEEARQTAKVKADDSLKMAQILSGLTGEKLSFQERRNDIGPNFETMANLFAKLGESGLGGLASVPGVPATAPAAAPTAPVKTMIPRATIQPAFTARPRAGSVFSYLGKRGKK